MTGFALYRLPYEQQVTMVAQTKGDPLEFASCEALNGQTGFVVAPFAISQQTPVVLIRPDIVQTFTSVPDSSSIRNCQFPWEKLLVSLGETASFLGGNSCRATYSDDFNRFFLHLKNGDFRKLVLSRCAEHPVIEDVSPLDLYQRACLLYPRMFISLIYTKRTGCWLTATPEILLEGNSDEWRTIALAGTMKLKDDELQGEGEGLTWSTKNIQEQRYVATYLKECLEQLAKNIQEEGPRTVRAANLVHLRSDFTFTLLNDARVGDVLQKLHPTPAVCGLPKQESYRFITENEHTPRLYYSGFMGPLSINGSTHLFVSLRCMLIMLKNYMMYAGGGLLKDSVEEQEWQETEAKLETMRRVLGKT